MDRRAFVPAVAHAAILYPCRRNLLGGVPDKTWVVEIDTDALSEATYESEFSGDGNAISIASELSHLILPRTENGHAYYAHHGKKQGTRMWIHRTCGAFL